jgi:hypothetical protein
MILALRPRGWKGSARSSLVARDSYPPLDMMPASDPELRQALSAQPAETEIALVTRRSGARRALRGVVALACARLRSAGEGRLGTAVAAAITLGFGVVVVVLRIEDGTTSLEAVFRSASPRRAASLGRRCMA